MSRRDQPTDQPTGVDSKQAARYLEGIMGKPEATLGIFLVAVTGLALAPAAEAAPYARGAENQKDVNRPGGNSGPLRAGG